MTPRPIRSMITCLTLLAIAPIARADAQSIGFGLMAGGSLSTFTGDLAKDARNYAGFIAGGFVHLGLGGFAVEPGVFYTRKGSKSSDANNDVTNKLSYIQIPLVIKVHLPFVPGTRLYVGAGPAIGVNVGCQFVTVNSVGTTDQDCSTSAGGADLATPATEISAIGVAGIDIGKFSLGLRGDFAVNNTYTQLASNPTKADLKTQTISAIAAIRF